MCTCDSLSLSYMAIRTLRRFHRNIRSPHRAHASTNPLPGSASVSAALTADSVPLDAQVVCASSPDRVFPRITHTRRNSVRGMDVGVSGSGSLTMAQRTLATLWDRTIMLKASPPLSVVRCLRGRRRASNIGHGVAGICHERSSPVLSLSSSASVLCLDSPSISSPANVECEFDN